MTAKPRHEGKRFRESTVSLVPLLAVLCLLLAVSGCHSTPEKDTKGTYGFISPTFSPDNKKIVLAFCDESRGYDACDVVTYDLSNGDVQRLKPTESRLHGAPIYSPDGTKIAFVDGEGDVANVFVMSSSGDNVRQLTFRKKGASGKTEVKLDAVPTFSPDGERVIFIRSENKRERTFGRGKMFSRWDAYEVDLKTGTERKLTDYKFYMMSRPYYLPDGKHFIFSGDGPKVEDLGFNDRYEKTYRENRIFIMDGKENELKPAFQNGRHSSNPAVSLDGTVLFTSITNKMDGIGGTYNYDLFIRKGGQTNRLTSMKAMIVESAISYDGSRVVFIADTDPERKGGPSLWVMNSDGSDLKEIKLPRDRLRQMGAGKTVK
ncbi:MAG: hypothetical protein NTV99_08040 [Deltaproteobacteria bacterium]|nr:hypothetical protein [Deltaproteobacteria bacterium]